MQVNIYRGDTPLLQFTLKKSDGTVLALTGAKVYFAARRNDGLTADIDAECTILTPATAGRAEIRLTTTHTATAGAYIAEVEVRFTGPPLLIYTATQFTLNILDDVRKG